MTPAARPLPPAEVFPGGPPFPPDPGCSGYFLCWASLPFSSLLPKAYPWASPKPSLSSQGSLFLPTSHPDLSHPESAEATRGPLLDISESPSPIAFRFCPLLILLLEPLCTLTREGKPEMWGAVWPRGRPHQTCSAVGKSKTLHETPLLRSLRIRGFQPSLSDTPLHYTQVESGWGIPAQASSGGTDPPLIHPVSS